MDIAREDLTLDLDGTRLAARWLKPDHGRDHAAPIVLLHEGLGCIAMWKDFPERLARATGRAVFLYDRQGYGRSSALTDPRTDRYLHDYAQRELPAVLNRCGIEKPVLFGHSDGGSIALLYAAQYPATAVVTEAAHVFVEDVTLAGIEQAVEAWHTTDLKDRLARYHGDKTEQVFFAWADTWRTETFRQWNIEDDITAVSAPALILQGAEDEYGTPKQVEAIAAALKGPVETALLPACRHVPHFQARDAVLAQALDFLERCNC